MVQPPFPIVPSEGALLLAERDVLEDTELLAGAGCPVEEGLPAQGPVEPVVGVTEPHGLHPRNCPPTLDRPSLDRPTLDRPSLDRMVAGSTDSVSRRYPADEIAVAYPADELPLIDAPLLPPGSFSGPSTAIVKRVTDRALGHLDVSTQLIIDKVLGLSEGSPQSFGQVAAELEQSEAALKDFYERGLRSLYRGA